MTPAGIRSPLEFRVFHMALRYTSSDFLSDLRLTSFHKRGLSFAVCLSGPAPNETLNAPGKVFHVRRLRHQEPLRGLARLRDLALRRYAAVRKGIGWPSLA